MDRRMEERIRALEETNGDDGPPNFTPQERRLTRELYELRNRLSMLGARPEDPVRRVLSSALAEEDGNRSPMEANGRP